MGNPKRCRKKYDTPGHPWQKTRIEEEAKLLTDYGLKSKRELWKHETELRNFRSRARKMARLTGDAAVVAKAELFAKLDRIGVLVKKDTSLDDVLGLTIKDFLERRLQTQVYRQSLAHTPKQARQFIIHGHIALGDKKATIPSLAVTKGLESTLKFRDTSKISKTHVSVPKVVVTSDEGREARVPRAPKGAPAEASKAPRAPREAPAPPSAPDAGGKR